MSEWKTIDSAPKDGTVFFGMSKDDTWPQAMKWEAYDADDVEETGEPGYWTYCESLISDVTGSANPAWWHPMLPLPEPEQ